MTTITEITETAVPLADLADSWLLALAAERKSPATIKAYQRGAQGFIAWYEQNYPTAVPPQSSTERASNA